MFYSFLSRCRFRLILNTPLSKQKRGERIIRRIGMTMRYVKIVLQSGKCRTAKRSIAHCRSKKWSSGWGPQGCSKSPSNFPIVRERVLRDARKLKKRLVGAPGFEPGGLLRPRQARWPNNHLLAAQL